MNHVFLLTWNERQARYVPAPEFARRRGKSSGLRVLSAAVLSSLSLVVYALPGSGQISTGQGAIAQSGSAMTVTQKSQNLAVNWQTFSIGANESVRFAQPNSSAIALNRVLGADPSQILGKLSANGQVWILNPNGLLFGSGAQVSVGGLLASTLSLSDADFLAGKRTFTGTGGSVTNQGSIVAADGGYVALLGAQVSNEGSIEARLGSVALGAGSQITLEFAGNRLLKLQVDQGVVDALAQNKQLIRADGGSVLLSAKAADALVTAVVNNEGIIEARTVENRNGIIRLIGGALGATDASMVINTGSLRASDVSAAARSILQAGSINANKVNLAATYALVQTAAGNIVAPQGSVTLAGGENTFLSGSVDTSANQAGGKGGNIAVTGNNITLAAARLNASGTTLAGKIHVGGGAHGADATLPNSQTVAVNGTSTLAADGTGGEIVVWSDQRTDFFGKARAGNASFIEISSKGTLNLGGTAMVGNDGQVLFDPTDIVIDASAPVAFYQDISGQAAPTPVPNPGTGAALANGNILVVNPADSFGGSEAGAAYLYNGTTGALISALYGSHANDQLSGLTVLTNGNFVVSSSVWNGFRGSATWGNGTTGISGVVSAANSLVGSVAGGYNGDGMSPADNVGSGGITPLSNGNYVVSSPWWNYGRGAATWGNGATGTKGTISAANSLVGSTAGGYSPWGETAGGDYVSNVPASYVAGGGITALANGNYVVLSANWNGRGAATWGNGTTGTSGTISSANSLVASGNGSDNFFYPSVTALANGNYVVSTGSGAATWGNGSWGITGTISLANSLIGAGVGAVTALANGNYVVTSALNGLPATTWGNGTTGITGAVSSSNTLANSGDYVAVVPLANGNYTVSSYFWNGTSGPLWLVADPANLAAMINGVAGATAVSPTALALAGGAGSHLTLSASHNITVNSPVSLAGSLALLAGNAVTLNASLTSTATGDALVLSAPIFINNAGSGALSTPNGRWLVYSRGPAGDVFGNAGNGHLISGQQAWWNKTFAANPPASIATGNRYVFAQRPTLTFTSSSATKTYGADLRARLATLYSAAGFVNASLYHGAFSQDTLANTFTGAPSITSAAAAPSASVSGSPYAVRIAAGTLVPTSGYALAFNSSGRITVKPAALTISANSARKSDDGLSSSGDDGVTDGGRVLGESIAGMPE